MKSFFFFNPFVYILSRHIKKRDSMVCQFVFHYIHIHSPLFELQTYGLYLKLPQSLYYRSANSKDSGETAHMRRLA